MSISVPIAIADTNALYNLLRPKQSQHERHRAALPFVRQFIVSPMVLAELDHLITARAKSSKYALQAMTFLTNQHALNRFVVPDVGPHLGTAAAVGEAYKDARRGEGIGITDAMNVALAKAYETNALFTSDKDFRMIQPLTGHAAFRLLPDDLESS